MTSITTIYAGFFGFLLVYLSWRVVNLRNKHQIKFGDGGHTELTAAVRAQGNLVEYLPTALLLMFVLEFLGTHPMVIHALGATLVIARVMHLKGMNEPSGKSISRKLGTRLTWVQILVASSLCFLSAFGFIF
jgi:uncharacterized membrane protein YecN with MAPEG domain